MGKVGEAKARAPYTTRDGPDRVAPRGHRQMTYYTDHPDFGFCRGLAGHAWQRTSKGLVVDHGDVVIVLQCRNCEATRTDQVALKDGSVKHRYKLPDGYRLTGKPSKSAVRLEYVNHLRGTFKARKQA